MSLKKNTAGQIVPFGLTNASTGAALTGATVTVKVNVDGTQSSAAGSVTESGSGQYYYSPTQAETNGNALGFGLAATNAVYQHITIYPDAVDANGFLSVNMADIGGQTVTAAAGVTFPSSVASPTNITAGTITTVTNLTNAPTAGDFTATMKTSLNAATPAVTVSDKTGFSLTVAYDAAKVAASQTTANAIKAQTDQMVFTVSGQIDSNIQYVNDVQVKGVGTSGSPWGPV